MSDMVLIVFVCLVCLVRMFIEKYQEQGTIVKKKVVHKPVSETSSNIRYLSDLTRREVKELLGVYLYSEEKEETIDLEELKEKFKNKHDKWDKEQDEYILRPVVDKSDNLFSFNPQAHEDRERRYRESQEQEKRHRENQFYESFMRSRNKPILV